MYEKFLKLYCTFFFLGYSPVAPGTAGTIGAIFIFYIISGLSWLSYLLTILLMSIFSIFITNKILKYYKSDDPSEIVIDEVCGYLFTMFLVPLSWVNITIGFILFRIFDVVKPYPIKRVENLKGGYGIIIDDVLDGIYSNIILLVYVNY